MSEQTPGKCRNAESAGWRHLLRLDEWQGIAGVLGIVGILVTLLLSCGAQGGGSQTATNSGTGNVAINNDGGSVVVAPQDKADDKVGKPPQITIQRLADRCHVAWNSPLPSEQIEALMAKDPLKDGQEWATWRPAAEGAPAAPRLIRLTVEGDSEHEIFIQDIRVRVMAQKPLVSRTLLMGGCGDARAYRWLQADLDKVDQRGSATVSPQYDARFLPEDIAKSKKVPYQFPYAVSRNTSEEFIIQTQTEKCTCGWEVEVDWAGGGASGTLTLMDGQDYFWTTTRSSKDTCSIIFTGPYCVAS
ncbi:hypothetical protein J5X84_44185 [Streptosporangiaceae bacterium NEAU-GS5]|nr:hypothetical protein [Streptosporangiaceae bacterium NEAU-GS5]